MGPLMMGGGVLVTLFVLLLIIGVPLLIGALVVSGRFASRSRSPAEGNRPSPPPATALPVRRCPTCERGVQPDWNVCPHCGKELT